MNTTENHKRKILAFYRTNKRMPGYRELMELTGFKSKNAVFKLLNRLVSEGAVEKDSQGRLTPKRLVGEVPLLGLVEAGLPSAAEEELIDTMDLNEYLVDDKKETYLLRVKGDSMIDAGIREGDMVLVERGREFKDGDIVIAEVDGAWTVKYYRKHGTTVFLEPANRNFKPIYPTEYLHVAAVVKAVIRKY